MKRTLKRVGCVALTAGLLVGSAFCFTSCTTDRPEVEIQLSFKDETYTLHYTLYRKIAPNTVNHFLALAENGYYNGLCVHDYVQGNKLYTGAYEYDPVAEETGHLLYKDYYNTVKSYSNFPVGVWIDSAKTTPTYTLYGEFAGNDVSMGNGSFLTQEYGALTMYYTPKTAGDYSVYVQKVSEDKVTAKDYKYNSATSMFSISLRANTDRNYCTFATLNGDSKSTLESMENAIKEYANNYEGDGSFTVQKTLEVDEDDYFLGEDGGNTETYNIPETPIVINYVKVNKY